VFPTISPRKGRNWEENSQYVFQTFAHFSFVITLYLVLIMYSHYSTINFYIIKLSCFQKFFRHHIHFSNTGLNQISCSLSKVITFAQNLYSVHLKTVVYDKHYLSLNRYPYLHDRDVLCIFISSFSIRYTS
jgi:hypothetical protein